MSAGFGSSSFDFLQSMLQAFGDRVGTETQPFLEDLLERLDLRAAVQPDHVEVDAEALLEVGGREQVLHHRAGVDAVGTRDQHQSDGVLVVGFVAQVFQHRQFLGAHLRGDLLDHLGG